VSELKEDRSQQQADYDSVGAVLLVIVKLLALNSISQDDISLSSEVGRNLGGHGGAVEFNDCGIERVCKVMSLVSYCNTC
jgi:hypothetical protein